MKTCCLPFAAALLLAATTLPVTAQTSTSAPRLAASSPAPVKAGPRLATPTEMSDSSLPPGALRPEHPVTPQVSIPLGKKRPAPPTSPSRAPLPDNAASAVEDEVARCEAQRGEQVRAKCRDELARQARIRRGT
jgi:hypothetical protein